MNIRLKFSLRKTLLKVINSLEEENKQLKNKMKQKEHDNLILLDNSIELRRKIKDLCGRLCIILFKKGNRNTAAFRNLFLWVQ